MAGCKAQQLFVASVAVLSLLSSAGQAQARGCIKGAAVGAVAGHVAGHHAVVGAVAGCAVGHHLAKKAQQRRRQLQGQPQPPQSPGVHSTPGAAATV